MCLGLLSGCSAEACRGHSEDLPSSYKAMTQTSLEYACQLWHTPLASGAAGVSVVHSGSYPLNYIPRPVVGQGHGTVRRGNALPDARQYLFTSIFFLFLFFFFLQTFSDHLMNCTTFSISPGLLRTAFKRDPAIPPSAETIDLG